MYKIVAIMEPCFVDAKHSLEIQVNILMEDGWIPQGGISVAQDVNKLSTYYIVSQAMVKNEK